MRKPFVIVCAALGVSLLVNLLTISRLRRVDDRETPRGQKSTSLLGSPAKEDAKPAVSDNADMRALAREIRSLREEVASMRGSGSGSPAKRSADPEKTSGDESALSGDPEVAELLREQGAMQDFWNDLQKVMGLRKMIDDVKYRKLVFEKTAEFLGLSLREREGFCAAADLMISDLGTAIKEYTESSKRLTYDQKDPQGWQRQSQELLKVYQERQKQASSRLDPFLNTSARHRQFKQNAATWAYYVNPKSGGDWSWQADEWTMPEEDP